MKKIKLSHDMYVPGLGVLEKGTPFKVEKFNKRFVYAYIADRVTLRLARKSDCKIVY